MLTDEQKQELQRLRQYFPYRIIFGVLEGETFTVYASKTKHKMNKFVREGKQVFQLKGKQ